MAETVFLSENNIQVTNSRFIVNGQTYAMSNVTSVKNQREEPSILLPFVFLVFGIFCMTDKKVGTGIFLIAIGLFIYHLLRQTHRVVLNTAGGEVEALKSRDVDFIVRIVKALNDAIVHRG